MPFLLNLVITCSKMIPQSFLGYTGKQIQLREIMISIPNLLKSFKNFVMSIHLKKHAELLFHQSDVKWSQTTNHLLYHII